MVVHDRLLVETFYDLYQVVDNEPVGLPSSYVDDPFPLDVQLQVDLLQPFEQLLLLQPEDVLLHDGNHQAIFRGVLQYAFQGIQINRIFNIDIDSAGQYIAKYGVYTFMK